ncbi:U-scoloptoxin(01)-Cw1a-like isoform X2 [Panulirus ornatus]
MKVVASAFLCLVAVASARMAYQLPDGFLGILGDAVQEAFSCEGRPFGYYADVTSKCRIFHVCQPIPDEFGVVLETAHFSFLCGNLTVFNQETLTCAYPEDAYPCELAEEIYDISNIDFFKIPEAPAFPDY